MKRLDFIHRNVLYMRIMFSIVLFRYKCTSVGLLCNVRSYTALGVSHTYANE